MSEEAALMRFRNQYLQMVDLQGLAWPPSSLLRVDSFQQQLWTTIFSPEALHYAPPDRYQSRVLKELVKRAEEAIMDPEEDTIHDDLASRSALLNATVVSELVAAQQNSYLTYSFSRSQTDIDPIYQVTLLENPALIMIAGTTGVRTWEAARHLGAFLCTPEGQSLIAGRNVLELGAGTGLLSILCARHLRAHHVMATDGDPRIVENVRTNFFLNNVDSNPAFECQILRWGTPLLALDREELTAGLYDVVLGADITYDAKLFPSLIMTIKALMKAQPRATVIISATLRNEETIDKFTERCRVNSLDIQDLGHRKVPANASTGPFYSDAVPIRIMQIVPQPVTA